MKSLTDHAGDLFKHSFNDEGRNLLSYAAFIGFIEGVQLLLENFPALEFECDQDEDGSFPIHQATKGGHVNIIKLFKLSACFLNNKQQNILHVAAGAGKYEVVYYLLKRQDQFKDLILNTGDADGNTPLHLAAKGYYVTSVNHLITKKYYHAYSLNKELFTSKELYKANLQYSKDEHFQFQGQVRHAYLITYYLLYTTN